MRTFQTEWHGGKSLNKFQCEPVSYSSYSMPLVLVEFETYQSTDACSVDVQSDRLLSERVEQLVTHAKPLNEILLL